MLLTVSVYDYFFYQTSVFCWEHETRLKLRALAHSLVWWVCKRRLVTVANPRVLKGNLTEVMAALELASPTCLEHFNSLKTGVLSIAQSKRSLGYSLRSFSVEIWVQKLLILAESGQQRYLELQILIFALPLRQFSSILLFCIWLVDLFVR